MDEVVTALGGHSFEKIDVGPRSDYAAAKETFNIPGVPTVHYVEEDTVKAALLMGDGEARRSNTVTKVVTAFVESL